MLLWPISFGWDPEHSSKGHWCKEHSSKELYLRNIHLENNGLMWVVLIHKQCMPIQ